jgi:Zn finger protein HypA/HybF involved in hydrogenase expression
MPEFEMSTQFCETCHIAVYTRVTEGEDLKIIQRGKTVLNSKVGSSLNLTLKCPDGHSTKVKIGDDKEMVTSDDSISLC